MVPRVDVAVVVRTGHVAVWLFDEGHCAVDQDRAFFNP